MASVGTITAIGIPVLTGALGYGGRFLQNLLDGKAERQERQRSIAGEAQKELDVCYNAAYAWARHNGSGSTKRRDWGGSYAVAGQKLSDMLRISTIPR